MPNPRKPTTRRRQKMQLNGGDPEVERKVCIFPSAKMTSQQNSDPAYVESGIIHMSESQAINAVRGTLTSFANVFGAKGVDNTIYDNLRNLTLNKLENMLKPDEKICNLRMEFANPMPDLLYHHIYGTLLKKKNSDDTTESNPEESKSSVSPVLPKPTDK